MKAIYSLAVMCLMFVGANALADSLDRHVNGGDASLSVVSSPIKPQPNFVIAKPQPICPPAPAPKPVPNYIISGPVHF